MANGIIQELGSGGPARHSASIYFRPTKQQITLRVDSDVIAWFRANHPRYQTLMNAVLRKEMMQALEEEELEKAASPKSGGF